ncbi:TlyA family RNA methyltransferase [Pelotomaculum sp. FP]|uniref:TlyA family RNA methyltransferase n=1 Tax=Pelotomaculum sp. FP TaxID=261474 RepID=UPI0010647ADB|nr:TlyA family RNA methyltransferase [Pelotomaculum sp. FP]
MQKNKQRLDVRLTAEGYCPSREKARAAIMAGLVFVDGLRVDKPGVTVSPGAVLEVKGSPIPYVSRGGLKLEKAIKVFEIDLSGRVVLDVGASTGGFTDCALKYGASQVYAVDVGYGQLDWKLRNDPRVVVLERTNIRYLNKELLSVTPDFITIDVSFISLTKVLPKIGELTTPAAAGVALVKPQFEAGRDKIGKKGVVRDPEVQLAVLQSITGFIEDQGWSVRGVDYSPVTGPEGNIEFLVYFDKSGLQENHANLPDIVKRAHAELT